MILIRYTNYEPGSKTASEKDLSVGRPGHVSKRLYKARLLFGQEEVPAARWRRVGE
jgi:hypothetical protein